jgi:hypothetical protein
MTNYDRRVLAGCNIAELDSAPEIESERIKAYQSREQRFIDALTKTHFKYAITKEREEQIQGWLDNACEDRDRAIVIGRRWKMAFWALAVLMFWVAVIRGRV